MAKRNSGVNGNHENQTRAEQGKFEADQHLKGSGLKKCPNPEGRPIDRLNVVQDLISVEFAYNDLHEREHRVFQRLAKVASTDWTWVNETARRHMGEDMWIRFNKFWRSKGV